MAASESRQSDRSLSGIAIFASLPAPTLRSIEGRCSWRTYDPKQVIVEYLKESDDVFFVVEGRARVLLYSQAGHVVSFRDLTPGDTFGELAAIDRGPRSASVEAQTDCLVAALPAAVFRELLSTEPSVAQAVLRQQAGTIRRLTSRVHEFSAAVMSITGRKIYSEMQTLRSEDAYPDEEIKAYLLDKSFPASAEEMTLRLSNVTAAFYGLMLKNVGEQFGWGEVDKLSRRVFRELGRLKTREAIETGIALPNDCRALAVVFITAVHSASPEYNFHVLEYLPEDTVVHVFGVSRYDRIAKRLDIEQHLTWPELTPFFEGIAEESGVKCKVATDLKELGDAGRYDCTYRFTAA
ncbi:cyclic nucleotide-binding domain-containing protein [Hyphomicrobium sp. CS1GBMeth3]|uniref:Crp/Fnr family transcriptional regulator n=1 Tax=Hyphomicrobium sp. CS1GBMeth3 TaxID=1892845 RepID=UPI0009F99BEC|nr:cyclic nucleotide-binding domain-containing protein [Hyphomicrobium sp. CS1GBMeth3]